MSVRVKQSWRCQVSDNSHITSLALGSSGKELICGGCEHDNGNPFIVAISAEDANQQHRVTSPCLPHKDAKSIWLSRKDGIAYAVLSDGTLKAICFGHERLNSVDVVLKLESGDKGRVGWRALLVSPDEEWLMTCSYEDDGNIIVWKKLMTSINSSPLQYSYAVTLKGHSAGVLCMAASPDGSLVFSGSYDKTIRVWKTSTWTCHRVLKGHGGGIRAMAVTANGATLYSAAADNTVRVWSTSAWVCLRMMHGRHEDTTWPAVMALHDGDDTSAACGALVTGSTGPFGYSSLKLYDTRTGKCVATLAHLDQDVRGSISAVLFSQNGDTLYSAATDGSVVAWCIEQLSAEHDKDQKPRLKSGFFT